MGSSDEVKSTKSEKKSSTTAREHNAVHVYPDWAAMQAYYGPGVALPQYYQSPVAAGYPPPQYIWGPPQPMMPPYAAIYPHAYAHPAVQLVSVMTHLDMLFENGSPWSISPASPPLGIDTPLKSSASNDKGLIKKLKGFDGLAMSIGNGNPDKTEGEAENILSQSADSEGSNNGSDGDTDDSNQIRRKRSREGTSAAEAKKGPASSGQTSSSAGKVLGVPVAPASDFTAVNYVHAATNMTLDLKNKEANVKVNAIVPAPTALMSSEAWMQNERELKREKRKQSNRESARRSRLRKQAETEELGKKVETLLAQNRSLKSEINQLAESSVKLKSENASLIVKLKNVELSLADGVTYSNIDKNKITSINTENLLSKVDNSGPASGGILEEGADAYEKSTKTGTKLHQLLDVNPRVHAMAAG
ncbi:Common plant regulatory factor 1-like protein [Drosera capensis]